MLAPSAAISTSRHFFVPVSRTYSVCVLLKTTNMALCCRVSLELEALLDYCNMSVTGLQAPHLGFSTGGSAEGLLQRGVARDATSMNISNKQNFPMSESCCATQSWPQAGSCIQSAQCRHGRTVGV